MTQKHLTDQKFSDLSLDTRLQQGLAEAGFEYCTPIQAESLPHALQGVDVAGQAKTGTGKTIAFLLACCNRLLSAEPMAGHQPGQPRALILAPTRELAIQIHKDALLLNKHTGLSIGLVYGGTGYDQQKTMLARGTDILIGTPGRLIDFFRQDLFSLKHAEIAILDEADRMFDLGFIKDIRFLLRRMPPAEKRLNLLFSATLSFRVMELAYEHMNNPMEIKIDTDEVVADKVVETSYYPSDEEKLPLLINMLRSFQFDRVLVFVNTRYAAEDVAAALRANDIESGTLSGDVPQNKREQLLEQFKQGKKRVLVATDVAARGLHIPAVSHVVNYDLPHDAEDYVHRIGRTARAGASGEAISFICEKYAYSIMEIEEYIGHPLPKKAIDPEMLAPVVPAPPRKRRERGKGRDGPGAQGRSARGQEGRGRRPRRKSESDHTPRPAGPETQSGEFPAGESRTGESRTGESRTGESRTGESRTGESRTGESRTGGPATTGQVEPAALAAGAPDEPADSHAPAGEPQTSPDKPPHLEGTARQGDHPATAGSAGHSSDSPESMGSVNSAPAADPESPGEDLPMPRQRFSRRFGEVPAIG